MMRVETYNSSIVKAGADLVKSLEQKCHDSGLLNKFDLEGTELLTGFTPVAFGEAFSMVALARFDDWNCAISIFCDAGLIEYMFKEWFIKSSNDNKLGNEKTINIYVFTKSDYERLKEHCMKGINIILQPA